MIKKSILLIVFILGTFSMDLAFSQEKDLAYENSKPWVYWYWMQSAYSKEGITADLEAMKEAGIAGAYLMTIKGPTDPPLIDPPILQLSDQFWKLVGFAIEEADRLDLQIAMHAADGFAVAGGPWIEPEQSMQKVVWKDTILKGGTNLKLRLPQPEAIENYYEDIATFAILRKFDEKTSISRTPLVSSSKEDIDASFLTSPVKNDEFKLYEKGWVQYEFDDPFLCKSIQVESKGVNYQAQRLRVLVSDDGENFRDLGRLVAPRHGWQDSGIPYTHSIEPVTAKYFRFLYDPEGSEPGAEDLDAAKWKQSLKVSKIILSNQPKIGNFEGKSGLVWRISPETTNIKNEDYLSENEIIDISEYVDSYGDLNWNAPKGNWKIIRFGHTTTGQENETGGAGRGLEVDKFDPEAIKFQFQQWFGKSADIAGADLVPKVLSILHIDSWEAGSQNWSKVFRKEFNSRRGYDIIEFLPLMAGIPMQNQETSEQVLYDVRKTISELIVDHFFGTINDEAEKLGVKFSSENVAPTMVSDALMHFKNVDFPGGEFWLKSPTHDKPNDMLDAISGGHIYGKNTIQAEAFTELRMDWNEDPELLKPMADRNFALGINRFFYHVFVHNPWLDRKPGMTLDGVGHYFQRDQTWWKPGEAWVEYCRRVQYQLQKGKPVIDLAVFTGEELPSRAVLPDRLLPFIPNIFGKERIASEEMRLNNIDQPTAKMPKEVTYSKNVTNLNDWVNFMNGYKYDSFNPDVLLNDAKVVDGNIQFKGEIQYKTLLFPGGRKMAPNAMISTEVAEKILQLIKDGATIFVAEKPNRISGFSNAKDKQQWQEIIDEIWSGYKADLDLEESNIWKIGKGKVIQLPYFGKDFNQIGIEPDVLFPHVSRKKTESFAWNHRKSEEEDIYFFSNQTSEKQEVNISLRNTDKKAYIYDPVTDETTALQNWKIENKRTEFPLKFSKNGSLFIIFKGNTSKSEVSRGQNWNSYTQIKKLDEQWNLSFAKEYNGPKKSLDINQLFDWSTSSNDSIKHYSGTAVYSKEFRFESNAKNVWLNLGEFSDIAEVFLNGENVGVVWTFPHRINISKLLKKGNNTLEIKITNTWRNRLIGDHNLPEKERLIWTTAPYRLDGEDLLPAGLLGPVILENIN
ncbi:glycosyl hydrolase [Zunongwangia endophytica]|uniref:Glycosyl hydrolase n=1 Tax=Zunongwangia endophytica TaxID=1808945 RepID=A0ABV8H8R4_9FLAO|nr:glycosyl hydrolase [Zunongwangia endophytica]MDN3594842.1 glycosyl hydrolase [Zunongwangia endophytica]